MTIFSKSGLIALRLALMTGLMTSVMATSAIADDTTGVLENYANIAHAGFEDSLITANDLKAAINKFLAMPNTQRLADARQAWLDARVPYQQTEAFRFGNAIVDDWEGRVNAWPLDEGLIDYVSPAYGSESDNNGLYVANVVSNSKISLNGQPVDVSIITPELIGTVLHEAGGVESNVATGYHAIEFLLWGQDLNGTSAGAGSRPASDFDLDNCSNDNCDRRRDYLRAATELLIADLEEMVGHWAIQGAARTSLSGSSGLATILTGMGSLSYGELAGERMKLGLILHDPEEEHDCFSDNTHNSHFYDAKGIQNVYLGIYVRIDGSVVSGPSLASHVASINPDLDIELQAGLSDTMSKMTTIVERAESEEAYDQMIGEGNDVGNETVQAAIDSLIAQTRTIERVVDVLGLADVAIEGSDSLDSPSAVFQ